MNILGFLRHGPTSWNRSRQIQGIRDIPLDAAKFTAEPWQQLLARYGPWDRIVTSSLSRCLQTCDLLLPGQPYEVDADLREQDWGDWTGHTLKEIIEMSPGSLEAQERLGWDLTPPGGESRREVLARTLAAIHRATDNRDGKRILFITHLGVIKVLLNHLKNTPFLPGHSAPVAKRALHLIKQDGPELFIVETNIEIP
jgi:probable phosphoglycerate mutase